jgi:hypothetical protein
MGEKEFFDKAKELNRFLTNEERRLVVEVMKAMIKSREEE